MAIPFFNDEVDIISKLGTNPGSDDNLTEAQFKAKFDEAANLLKTFLNDILIPNINQTIDVESLLAAAIDNTVSMRNKSAEAYATRQLINERLPKTGGVLTGNLSMSSYRINNLRDPSAGSDAATKQYCDSKHKAAIVDIAVADWTAAEGMFIAEKPVEWMTATDIAHAFPVYSAEYSQESAAWANIFKAETEAGKIVFRANAKPGNALKVQIEVNR